MPEADRPAQDRAAQHSPAEDGRTEDARHEGRPAGPGLRELRLRELRRRLADDGRLAAPDSGETVRPRPEADTEPPVSSAQRQLLFLQELDPDSTAYNLTYRFDIDGPLDPDALRRAFTRALARHEVLRTTYGADDGGGLVQQVRQSCEPPWSAVDLSGAAAPADRLAELAARDARTPFALRREGPLRLTLATLGPRRHSLLMTLHHVAMDETTWALVLGTVSDTYGGEVYGRDDSGATRHAPLRYADFAAWEAARSPAATPALATARDYWRRTMIPAPPETELPLDRPRTAQQGEAAGTVTEELPGRLVARLTEVARRYGSTPFLTLLAAVGVVLRGYGTADEVVLGSPFDRRGDRPELAGVAGNFLTTLPLRVDLSGEPTLAQLLERVRGVSADAMAHRDLPLDALVREVAPERATGRNPLFDVVVTTRAPMTSLRLRGLRVRAHLVPCEAAQFDLLVALEDTGTGTRLAATYREELLDAATARRLLGAVRAVLEAVADDPERPVSAIGLLTLEERRELARWERGPVLPAPPGQSSQSGRSGGSGPEAVPRSLPEYFAATLERHPDATAVRDRDEALTYRQLDERSAALARRLVATGVTAEEPVAVCVRRSADMVVALLAVLRAGCCYLPLDPGHPAGRLAMMLADARPRVLLTDATTAELATAVSDSGPAAGARPAVAEPPVTLRVDGPQPAAPDVALPPPPAPERLAYTIFTSGSTGRPKGVMVPHGALAAFLAAMGDRPGLGPHEVLTAVTTLSFDIAALELFLPLVSGATVVVADRHTAVDGAALAALLETTGSTVLQATPATWRLLLAAHWRPRDGFRALCGGEALPDDLAGELHERGVELWNLYGPTETTIWSTAQRLTPEEPVRIGGPIPGTTARVLGPRLHPVPPGAVGELYLGGAGVARGYLGQPGLTAGRFVADPYGPPGARLYRTGDLVRWQRRPAGGDGSGDGSGVLEYVGRTDHQVKLRGYRVELGEVEAALRAQPGVRSAVAAVSASGTLTGWVCPEPGAAPEPAAVRGALRGLLPGYMVPGAVVVVADWPLTPNGKLDRARLPAPETGGGGGPAPAPGTERRIAAMIERVLDVRDIAADADFFDLGGHSLAANRLSNLVAAELGVRLGVRTVFTARTVAALAAHIDAAEADGGTDAGTAPEPQPRADAGTEPRPDTLPLSPGQRRLWYLDQLHGPSAGYTLPLPFRLRGPLDIGALRTALGALVRRHEILRTRYPVRDGEPYQQILDADEAAAAFEGLPVTDLDAPEAPAPDACVAADAEHRFHLATDLPLRATLYRLGAHEHLLVLVAHHIAVDEWSVRPLLADLATGYRAARDGERAQLPTLPLQYADYAVAERAAPEDATDAAYWADTLKGLPRELELPFGRDEPAPQEAPGAADATGGGAVEAVLPAGSAAAVRELAVREGASTFMAALTAVTTALTRLGAGTDIPLGAPVSGRTDEQLDELVGFFVNTVLLRLDASGDPSFRTLLRRVRETTLSAHDHQRLPFDRVVAGLGPAPEGGGAPVEVFVDHRVGALDVPRLDGVEATLEPAAITTAKFPLTLAFADEPDGSLRLTVVHSTARFDTAGARALADTVLRVLADAAAQPDLPLRAFDVTGPAERAARLAEGRGPDHPAPAPLLSELIEAQTDRTPDAVAVVDRDGEWTYAALDRRAETIADALTAAGVGPEDLVGLAAGRGSGTVAAMLGIWKAGAALLALDPDHPRDRLRGILADSACPLVLTTEEWRARFAEHAPVQVLAGIDRPADGPTDGPAAAPSAPGARRPARRHSPDSLAYAVYTSGSTGVPKGVLVTHRNASNLWATGRRVLGDRAEPVRLLQTATLTFDVAIFETVMVLCSGGCLRMTEEWERAGAALLDAAARHRVTHLAGTPTVLASAGDPARTDSSVDLLTGAERVPAAFFSAWSAGRRAVNLYGPTETTVNATTFIHQPADGTPWAGTAVPIGVPDPNVRAYVLDDALRPLPAGVTGDLYLGGAGVTRGYLGLPGLTAGRFVADPYAPEPGARMYRTGDRARWRLDGAGLHFAGRADDQVKLRGLRIELGEVEAALAACAGVTHAAAAVVGSGPDARLLGYVCLAEGGTAEGGASLDDVAHEVRGRLPAGVVPQQIIPLAALPRTTSGKLDRAALPVPELRRTGGGGAPRTRNEAIVVREAGALLGCAAGPDDGFFALGGDSIGSIQLVSRLRKQGLAVTPRAVAAHRTLGELAAAATGLDAPDGGDRAGDDGAGTVQPTPVLRDLLDRGPLPATFSQAALVTLPAGVTAAALADTLRAVTDRHQLLRARWDAALPGLVVPPHGAGDEAAGRINRVPVPATGPDEATRARERERAAGRLDPGAGVLFDAVWFDPSGPPSGSDSGRTAPGSLLLTVHHVVVDGVSWRILLEDLAAAWDAVAAGAPVRLPAVPTSFRRWSGQLHDRAATPDPAELAHWRAVFAPARQPLPPADPARDTAGATGERAVTLPPSSTTPLLRRLPATTGAGTHEAVLAALVVALRAWRPATGGGADWTALVEVEGHGRGDLTGADGEAGADDRPGAGDLSRTVGWFTAFAPARFDGSGWETASALSGGEGAGTVLRQTRQRLRAAPDGGLGWGVLRWLNPDTAAELAATARPSVAFNYLGTFAAPGAEPWTVSPLADALSSRTDPDTPLAHTLTVDAAVLETADGPRLRANLTWARQAVTADEIDDLAALWLTALRGMADYAEQATRPLPVPADFPLLPLSQAEVDRLTETRPAEDLLPLSPMQEGLLLHAADGARETGPSRETGLSPESGRDTYVVQAELRLSGPLDEGALRGAADRLVARHTALRAGFRRLPDGRAVSVVTPPSPVPWSSADLTGQPDPDAALERLRAVERRPFVLDEPPLLRIAVARVAEHSWCLLLTVHHLIADGWSSPVILRELAQLYRGETPPPARPYRDFLRALDGRDRTAARTAWRQCLAGLPGPTLLAAPGSGRRAPERHRELTETLDTALTTAITARARALGVPLGTAVTLAWGGALARQTGSADVTFGSVVSGRELPLPGLESMVGMCVNTVPVRLALRPGDTPAAAATRLAAAQTELLDHQQLDLSTVIADTGLDELFDSLLVIENYPLDPAQLGRLADDVRVDGITVDDATHYPVTLTVLPGPELRLRLSYRPDAVDAPTAAGLLHRTGAMLRAFANPHCPPLGRLDLLTGDERDRLAGWETGPAARPADDPAARFAATARAHPDTPALIAGEAGAPVLDYAELARRVDRFAAELTARRIGPEDVVALALPRGPEFVVALLGVLTAGAAYLPLDIGHPPERLARVLTEAAPALLVTDPAREGSLPGAPELPRLPYPADSGAEDRTAPAPDAPDAPPGARSPERPAYVIHTSGSTGRPKGVEMPVRALANLLDWHAAEFGPGPGVRTAQVAPLGFDVACQEILGALLTGRTLVLSTADQRRDPAALARLLADHGVHELFAPHLMIESLADAASDGAGLPDTVPAGPDTRPVPALRTVVQAGEALAPSARVRELCAGRRLHNHYGPTETHVAVAHPMPADPARWPGAAPIGRPVPGAAARLLDPLLNRVPPGVPGELYLCGAVLARGYRNRAALTSERFVADPYGAPGTRMYRTGDLAYWNAEGQLEYLGRADDQVKIRGNRVEPGEVRAALLEQPGVADAAVLAAGSGSRARLAAFVVPAAGGPEPVPAVLTEALAAALPDYMVPATVTVLPELPVGATGKTDRRALLALAERPAEEAGSYGRRPEVDVIRAAFAAVLDHASVTDHDDFFALGGHSLTAARLIAKLRAALGVEVALASLYEAPTPARLARRLDPAAAVRPALRPGPRTARAPLSAAQRRLWFFNRFGGNGATYHIPVALRLTRRAGQAPLEAAQLRAAFADLVSRHEALRTVFPDDGAEPVQVVREPLPEVTDVLRARTVPAAELARELAAEAAREFDLATELPLRATLFDTGEEAPALLVVVHHIAADGWAMRLLLRDLAALCATHTDGTPAPPAPAVTVTDHAHWQRALTGSEDDPDSLLAGQLEYWRERLRDLPGQLPLPADKPRPTELSYRGGLHRHTLPAELHRDLDALARRTGTSLFMVLQSALAALLTGMGAGEDIPLGTPVAGRNDVALEDVVGCFLNMLVLRTDTSGDPSFGELLARVREGDLAALAHQDVPFELLVDRLETDRSMATHPLVNVGIGLQDATRADLGLPGTETAAIELPHRVARLDLYLDAYEHRGDDGTPAGLSLGLEFSEDLFLPSTAASLAARLTRVLAAVAADESVRLSALPVADPDEPGTLRRWGAPALPRPRHTLPELIAERTAAGPERVALVAGGEALSYRELDRRADRFARALHACGAGTGGTVAVALGRGPGLLVALLGVWRSGNAYLPVDPRQPAERLRTVLAEACPAAVVEDAERGGEESVPVPRGTVRLCLDRSGTRAARPDGTALTADGQPEPPGPGGIAYLIFTSGSTGRPKGVVVGHPELAAMSDAVQLRAPLTPSDRLLAVSTVAFDVAGFELFAPLARGATVVLADEETVRDPDAVAALCAEQSVSVVQATPSWWSAVVGAVPGALRGLRALSAGEALPEPLARALHTAGATVTNLYGPTEATVYATVADWTPDDGAPTIGTPVPGTTALVADRRLRPVPVGVPGELYLGGLQVARGYHGRPALTAERFVADPYGAPGTRMYRTGDLARWTSAGRLEYLGRTDDQVKIRGHRVELGDLEAALGDLPGVRRAAAAVVQQAGGSALAGYVEPFTDSGAVPAPTPESVIGQLRRRLPDYLVPASVTVLDRLPLNASGKTDRGALPAPLPAAHHGRPPAPGAETTLAAIVAEVLGTDRVTADDNLFGLGLDSILTIQVASRARAAGLTVRPRTVFENPTVAGLAAVAAAAPPPPELPRPAASGAAPEASARNLSGLDDAELGDLLTSWGDENA